MPNFTERLRETFIGTTGSEGLQVMLANVQHGLRQQFPLCHVDTDAIEERLLGVAEEIAALRRRTADAVPELPKLNPEPEPVAPQAAPDAPAEPVSKTELEP